MPPSEKPRSNVSITKVQGTYPAAFPYDPDQIYPEYTGQGVSTSGNAVYSAVRENFYRLGLDVENYGTKRWNPLAAMVNPGDRVFIKPNLDSHEYRQSCPNAGDIYTVITHPSVIRAVADYVAIALQGEGEIVIGDNPSIDADFGQILKITQLHRFESYYRDAGTACRVLDLRPMITKNLSDYGAKSKVTRVNGDPEGSSIINLGKHSYFHGMNPLLFRGIFSKRWETIRHHHGDIHEYCISNTILNSDVFISIPKLKSHKKVGATLNIKGLVGINANKNFLIHWRIGFPKTGGDEYSPPHNKLDYLLLGLRHLFIDLFPESWLYRLRRQLEGTRFEILLKDTECLSFEHHRGAWEGNDTCWRMAADLFNVFVKDMGNWRKQRGKQLKIFSVIDGVLAGDKNGPFCPSPRRAEVILSGEDLLLVDIVATRLMDYDLKKIKYLSHLMDQYNIDLEQIAIKSDFLEEDDFFNHRKQYLLFEPPSNWENLITCN